MRALKLGCSLSIKLLKFTPRMVKFTFDSSSSSFLSFQCTFHYLLILIQSQSPVIMRISTLKMFHREHSRQKSNFKSCMHSFLCFYGLDFTLELKDTIIFIQNSLMNLSQIIINQPLFTFHLSHNPYQAILNYMNSQNTLFQIFLKSTYYFINPIQLLLNQKLILS